DEKAPVGTHGIEVDVEAGGGDDEGRVHLEEALALEVAADEREDARAGDEVRADAVVDEAAGFALAGGGRSKRVMPFDDGFGDEALRRLSDVNDDEVPFLHLEGACDRRLGEGVREDDLVVGASDDPAADARA